MKETAAPAPSSLSRLVLVVCAALWAAAVGAVVVTHPQGIPVSADASAPALPLGQALLPPAVGMALVLLLPLRRTAQPALVEEPRAFRRSTWVLLGTAVLMIVLGPLGVDSTDFVLVKALTFLTLPAIVLRFLWQGGVRVRIARGAWRWWAPLVVVAVWTWLAQAAPWVEPADFSGTDVEFLIVAAVVTAVTAGVGEELFYRRWLQTRLEAGLGPAAGILATSILFALMHTGTHGIADLPMDLAVLVAVQGTMGLFLGLLWWRYRNIAANIVLHLIVNGWPVVAYLLSLG